MYYYVFIGAGMALSRVSCWSADNGSKCEDTKAKRQQTRRRRVAMAMFEFEFVEGFKKTKHKMIGSLVLKQIWRFKSRR